MKTTHLPVAIIGAGPVGLAAASHLLERGIEPLILEAGPTVGHAVNQWAHVRLFSPWKLNIDLAAERLLRKAGWVSPDPEGLPTGRELLDRYLMPLARLTELRGALRLNTRVAAVAKKDSDKMKNTGREASPFVIFISERGNEDLVEVRAVIDASGAWFNPNPIGASGLKVPGESQFRNRIAYSIPDVSGHSRDRYAGKRVAVVGGGHSAMQVVLDLIRLQERAPETAIYWVMRKAGLGALGSGSEDALPARRELLLLARTAVKEGRLSPVAPFYTRRLISSPSARNGIALVGEINDREEAVAVDEIIVATGFRPDLELVREVRKSIDPAIESAEALAPLIDPNYHSCGTVQPHGVDELRHPDENFFIAGMKSYGRAPTFLMATGYEQVRSIASWLAGDLEAARRIELRLPETGNCQTEAINESREPAASCCGVGGGDGRALIAAEGREIRRPLTQHSSAGCCG